MRESKTYKLFIRNLFTVWVALHTFNYSVDIDAVLFSQANYSTSTTEYNDKIESFLEIAFRLIGDDYFDEFEDNPFSQNESKSFTTKVFVYLPSIKIIDHEIEHEKCFKEQLDYFYLDQNYPTPSVDIIPPPPRVV